MPTLYNILLLINKKKNRKEKSVKYKPEKLDNPFEIITGNFIKNKILSLYNIGKILFYIYILL